MTTDVPDETEIATELLEEETDQAEELAILIEATAHKVDRDRQTPCSACGLPVKVKENQCPHCDSNIAPNNALMRESLRRIDEIRAAIDGTVSAQIDKHRSPELRRGIWARIKMAFSSSPPAYDPVSTRFVPAGPRLLDTVSPTDTLTVLDCDGPWLKVKRRDGEVGWIYSTFSEND